MFGSILGFILFVLYSVILVAIGAYSHKYLAKVTGAPDHIDAKFVATDLVNRGQDAAKVAIDASADAAKSAIAKA